MMTRSEARKLARTHIAVIKDYLSVSNLSLIYLYLDTIDIDPPKAANDASMLLRLTCADWWTRRLISKDLKDREAVQIHKGAVARGRQIYCSNQSVNYIKDRQAKSIDCMSNKVCISDQDDEINMLDILKSSLANPENRRAELMVRMSGFEQYADDQNHVGMFYTITCPSKYHRFSGGGLNENYQHTPRDGQNYLTLIWSQMRAELKRHALAPYGFRVVEPHHDGTPHWHILLFMPQDQAELIGNVIRDYAMREDGDEPGAAQHRFEEKKIVKEIVTKDGIKKCSATGYIAKYISKNIGFDIQTKGEISEGISEVGQRVRCWASVWGIRQFQQIGGAPVTVWRELRRLKDVNIEHDVIKQARDFCILNDWSGFLKVMGGTDVKRIERELKLLKKTEVNELTGEAKVNKYKEIVEKVIGISAHAIYVITRTKKWTIVDKPSSIFSDLFGAVDPPFRPFGALGVL
ncbi:MAG: replication endonuclease [Methylobacter sp.]